MSGDVHVRFCEGPGVRFPRATHLVVMCSSRRSAEYALRTLRYLVGELGLELREDKTRIVHLAVGAEGLDFLGFHLRWVEGRRQYSHLEFLARWPSRTARQQARDRIRDMSGRSRLPEPVTRIVEDINRFLRGWAGYFRYEQSARTFDKIHSYAEMRLGRFVPKRHGRSRSFGWAMLYNSPDELGLLSLNGIVVAPRPNQPWRAKPHAAQ